MGSWPLHGQLPLKGFMEVGPVVGDGQGRGSSRWGARIWSRDQGSWLLQLVLYLLPCPLRGQRQAYRRLLEASQAWSWYQDDRQDKNNHQGQHCVSDAPINLGVSTTLCIMMHCFSCPSTCLFQKTRYTMQSSQSTWFILQTFQCQV